ncbi:MAG: hypothetical protein ABI472_01275, partial [Ginsengibacter sp.]
MNKIYSLLLSVFCFQQCNFSLDIFNRLNVYTKKFIIFFLSLTLLISLHIKTYADVTLSTSTLSASNINQGSNNNIVYASQMAVTVSAVSVNNIQFTLNGTLNASD